MPQKQAYDIKSFCQAYSVSRSYVYLEFKSGRLKFFKAGRRTLISCESAERWQRLLEETGSEAADTAPATAKRFEGGSGVQPRN